MSMSIFNLALQTRRMFFHSFISGNNTFLFSVKAISFAENFQAVHLPTFYNLTHLNVSFVLSTRGGAALKHVLRKSPNLYSLHFFQVGFY